VEGLIPLLADFQSQEVAQSVIQHAQAPKRMKKLTESYLMIDTTASESERACFGFAELLRSSKNFFGELLEQYHPLLAELSLADN